MWSIEKIIFILIKYCKRFHPKNLFYEKVKMTTKRTIIIESFVIVNSFDYDRTPFTLPPMMVIGQLMYKSKDNLQPHQQTYY
jgi:hypothetical protein